MKNKIVYIFAAVLLCTAFTACGAGNMLGLRPDTENGPHPAATDGNTVSPSPAVIAPDRSDGLVRDDDGIITDDDTGAESDTDGEMQHRDAAEPSMKPESSSMPAATPGNNHP